MYSTLLVVEKMLFLIFSVMVANPRELLCTVANTLVISPLYYTLFRFFFKLLIRKGFTTH